MPFSESLKAKIRKQSNYLCCLCRSFGVDVHHIIPQAEGGEDTEENATPLCSGCHDLYGDNPNKRKQIREARDSWFEKCERMNSTYSMNLTKALDVFVTREEFDKLKHELKELKRGKVVPILVSSQKLRLPEISAIIQAKIFINKKDFTNAKKILLEEVKKNQPIIMLGIC